MAYPKMSSAMRKLYNRKTKKFEAYAWPGGYPIFYLDKGNDVLCPKCASKPGYNLPITAFGINYEDNELFCEDCAGHIESAYG